MLILEMIKTRTKLAPIDQRIFLSVSLTARKLQGFYFTPHFTKIYSLVVLVHVSRSESDVIWFSNFASISIRIYSHYQPFPFLSLICCIYLVDVIIMKNIDHDYVEGCYRFWVTILLMSNEERDWYWWTWRPIGMS